MAGYTAMTPQWEHAHSNPLLEANFTGGNKSY